MMSLEARRGREGSRWINERPTAEQVAEWFRSVPLHDGMDHEKYVGGITLIPGSERTNEVGGYDDDGFPQIVENVRSLTWTPYMKVETRIAYFWDYVANHAADGWVGLIEAVPPVGGDQLGLPPGFFAYRAADPKGGEARMIGATYRARILVRGEAEFLTDPSGRRVLEGIPVVVGTGSKTVPTATKWAADENALMKAETGAIGRALGVAGMLVLPGSGVATAEDMQEALAAQGAGTSPPEPTLPSERTAAIPESLSDEQLVTRGQQLLAELKHYPRELERFRGWAQGRGMASVTDLTSPALKGFVRKLERTLDDAKSNAQHTQEMPVVEAGS